MQNNCYARMRGCNNATPAILSGMLFPCMKRITPEDLIKGAEAVAEITGQSHIFIVGMASAAFSAPEVREILTDDIDLFTPDSETCFLDEVIASVGEGSPFESSHGFYVERLGAWVLLTQPRGWMQRALTVPHSFLTIRVLHPLDLLYNKLEVGRKKDLDAAAQILSHGPVSVDQIKAFIADSASPAETKAAILENLHRVLRRLKPSGS